MSSKSIATTPATIIRSNMKPLILSIRLLLMYARLTTPFFLSRFSSTFIRKPKSSAQRKFRPHARSSTAETPVALSRRMKSCARV